MTDYIHNLVERNLSPQAVLHPYIPSRYEPWSATADPHIDLREGFPENTEERVIRSVPIVSGREHTNSLLLEDQVTPFKPIAKVVIVEPPMPNQTSRVDIEHDPNQPTTENEETRKDPTSRIVASITQEPAEYTQPVNRVEAPRPASSTLHDNSRDVGNEQNIGDEYPIEEVTHVQHMDAGEQVKQQETTFQNASPKQSTRLPNDPPKPFMQVPVDIANQPVLSPSAKIEAAPPFKIQPVTRPEPTVHVTIGRIEVRATTPATPIPKKEQRSTNVMSLDEYLHRHARGGNR